MTGSILQRWTMRQSAWTGLAVVLALLGVVGTMWGTESGTALLVGTGFGAVGGAIGLFLVGSALDKDLKAVLAAVVIGFLARILLVAGGLVVTLRVAPKSPMTFVAGFFILFAAFVALEMLAASGHAARQQSQKAEAGR